MVFCGQCGYQLSPGDKTCPRCGAQTDANLIDYDPGTYNPTEISQAVTQRAPNQPARPSNIANPASWSGQAEAPGPLILGPVAPNTQFANEPTSMMSAPNYAPQQPSYPNYAAYQQPGSGAYNPASYQSYQANQAAVVAQIVEASQRGKVMSLLLILFGLLLLIGAIVVFLLSQQGIIFSA